METTTRPRFDLAKHSLPAPLLKALCHLFSQNLKGCMLVGGTALSGFYAGHRRSDDIDLFTADEDAQRAAILAIRSLEKVGGEFFNPFQTAHYFRTTALYEDHSFTIDAVLDPHLFEMGESIEVEKRITVASLQTLLMTKIATLVSRCAEKDLYDLIWLFKHVEGLDYAKMIELGKKLDGGFSGEAVLLSLSSANLKEEACDFSLDPSKTPKQIYQELLSFQKGLIKNLNTYLRKEPPLPLKKLVDRIRHLTPKKNRKM